MDGRERKREETKGNATKRNETKPKEEHCMGGRKACGNWVGERYGVDWNNMRVYCYSGVAKDMQEKGREGKGRRAFGERREEED